MLDFICMGSVELQGMRSKQIFENEFFFVHSGIWTHNPLIMRLPSYPHD